MEALFLEKSAQAYGEILLPGSKSISNRILLLAALCEGETLIHGLLDSDDIVHMKNALVALGIGLTPLKKNGSFLVTGGNQHFPNKQADLFLGNAGTAFRPLTAALALNDGEYRLHGVPRMHERPIGDLVDALRQLGCCIEYEQNLGYPPLKIQKKQALKTEVIQVQGNVSSQFLTALLLALPMLGTPSRVEVVGKLISQPYIEITLNLLEKFGVKIINHHWQTFDIVAGSHYLPPRNENHEIWVEGDASSASYFLAAGAISGKVTVRGIGKESIQGDAKFADVIAKMGAVISYGSNSITAEKPEQGLQGIEIDCLDIPDAAMTLATMALFAKGQTRLKNIASWRVKETDRIHAMATELRKLGAIVEEGDDYLFISPVEHLNESVKIDTYDDHRIAMCFSLVSFMLPITIMDPDCVSKTFPNYFQEFAKITTPINN